MWAFYFQLHRVESAFTLNENENQHCERDRDLWDVNSLRNSWLHEPKHVSQSLRSSLINDVISERNLNVRAILTSLHQFHLSLYILPSLSISVTFNSCMFLPQHYMRTENGEPWARRELLCPYAIYQCFARSWFSLYFSCSASSPSWGLTGRDRDRAPTNRELRKNQNLRLPLTRKLLFCFLLVRTFLWTSCGVLSSRFVIRSHDSITSMKFLHLYVLFLMLVCWIFFFLQEANVKNFSIYIHSEPGFVFNESTSMSPFFYGCQLNDSIKVTHS